MGAPTPSKLLLLLVAAVGVVAAAAVDVSTAASAARGRRRVHLRVYMHDVIRGPGQTAIQLIWGVGPPHATMPGRTFGDTVAIDDLLTVGPDIGSAAVGRGQGSYMLSSQREAVLVVDVTLALTAGPYNGSTLVVAGRDRVHDETRELAVVGGTGDLRGASGYVLWRTAKVWSEVHMALEIDVHATVPLPLPDDDDEEEDALSS